MALQIFNLKFAMLLVALRHYKNKLPHGNSAEQSLAPKKRFAYYSRHSKIFKERGSDSRRRTKFSFRRNPSL